MKKRILLIVLVAGLLIALFVSACQCRWLKVESFSLETYSYQLEHFSGDEAVGRIENARDAKRIAKIIWKDMYGSSVVYQIPYRVSYDEVNQVWLVRGSYLGMIPGGPHLLISATDGKVLAVWHDK